jgi:AcrR family transcriptional regulator
VRQLLSREERQASVVNAAAAAFARAGYAATSMDDVAAAAGVTKLIVYRHFEGKEELYRAVLERVSQRLIEEFAAGIAQVRTRGVAVRAHLTVAREDPDGYKLLWVHAAREPQFAEYATEYRKGAVAVADELIGGPMDDKRFRRWTSRMVISYLVEAVLTWLDVGVPARDDEFVERATDGLVALVGAFAPTP